MFLKISALIIGFVVLAVLNLTLYAEQSTEKPMDGPAITKAVAVLYPTRENEVHGIVTFIKTGDKIKVKANVEGLTPGKHGFHVHEFGDCSAPDGASAGGHFNPDGTPHGAPGDPKRHVGDLGNITAEKNGKAHLEMEDAFLSFTGTHSIIGRGVIVHAGEDDLSSQPSGNAGPRVACGVIGTTGK